MTRSRALLLAALLVPGCSKESAGIFVAGPAFEQSIRLSTAQGERATVRVREPLVLHAERRSGPWVVADRGSVSAESCRIEATPPGHEPEVADNLKWSVEPAGAARFNVEYRTDHTREVRFSEPGLYRVTALSHAWCPPPYGGNTLTVEVLDE